MYKYEVVFLMDYDKMDKEILIEMLRKKDRMIKMLYLEKERLNYFARIDEMTGVLNRRAGLELLEGELNLLKIYYTNLVVGFVDVDELKRVNDTFGHKEGDKLLISVAKILKESIKNIGFVIRMGGDEFLAVFPRTTIKEVKEVQNRICTRVEEVNKNIENYDISLSYGFYEYSPQMSVNELIQKADEEMYKEKIMKKDENSI